MMRPNRRGDYATYEIADFINDPFFQDWIIAPDAEKEAYWQNWVQGHPEKASTVDTAAQLLRSVRFMEYTVTDEQAELSLARAKSIIAERSAARVIRRPDPLHAIRSLPGAIRPLYKAAAILLLILSGVLLYYYKGHHSTFNPQSYTTAYGTTRSIYLPDSSYLVLNSHSSVQFAQRWTKGVPRELWLEGEAFFDVRHPRSVVTGQEQYGAFLVYTKVLTVEVLSTAFNIRERRGHTEVVLQSGRIKISFRDHEQPDILMKPGDQLTYDPQQQTIVRQTIIPENYTSWKDKKLTNATGRQIVEYLEDNYGKKVILEDPAMETHRFGGEVMLDKFDDALFALSTVMNVKIIQKNDTLIFRPR